MKLTPRQLRKYHDDGFLMIDNLFCASEVEFLRDAIGPLVSHHAAGQVLEEAGDSIRSVMGGQGGVPIWERLVRHPRLVGPASTILAGPVSVYQFKVNTKEGFKGAQWSWHQDYIFWKEEDGMLEPNAVTAAVYLDDSTELNGPLIAMAGSHGHGAISVPPTDASGEWRANARATLKYSLTEAKIRELAAEHPLVSLKGPAGTGLFFDCNIVHGSAPNMTPYRRAIAFVTYVAIGTPFRDVERPRPTYVADPACVAVETLPDNCLWLS